MRPIAEVARKLGLESSEWTPWGPEMAKVHFDALSRRSCRGQLVLMTAMSPSHGGEGKTTTAIGLVDALQQRGESAVAALREPSMGPVFGMKGGGTGGGRSRLHPSDEINLHFTGDIHAVSSAHNLLSAVIDDHLHQGNPLGLDVRRISWPRVVDCNDRALRSCLVGLGGAGQGVPRQDRFDITAASEVMAILALAQDWKSLRRRLGRIVVGYTREEVPVKAEQLGCADAMAALLRHALLPNLVQTGEGNPALVHCGPFANIAHGTSSLMATRLGLSCADWVVQEAGFGSDLGAEKFLNLFCRELGQFPALAVLVVTTAGIKLHGMENAFDHCQRLERFGLPVLVALNLRPEDEAAHVDSLLEGFRSQAKAAFAVDVYGQGGASATELARAVCQHARPAQVLTTYLKEQSLTEKIQAVSLQVYGAREVEFSPQALRQLQLYERLGYGEAYVCLAKTQMSLSHDPRRVGVARDFVLPVREVRLSAGAGFVVPVLGEMLTMPGLPARSRFREIGLDEEGRIYGVE